jgi:hypothetical protein
MMGYQTNDQNNFRFISRRENKKSKQDSIKPKADPVEDTLVH